MASISLDTVWVTLRDDLTQSVQLLTSELSHNDEQAGEVRTYAGGRRRSITRAGRGQTVSLTADLLNSRTTLTLLRSWIGRTVLLRDPYGLRVWGVFYAVPAKETLLTDMAVVDLQVESVTFSEAI